MINHDLHLANDLAIVMATVGVHTTLSAGLVIKYLKSSQILLGTFRRYHNFLKETIFSPPQFALFLDRQLQK